MKKLLILLLLATCSIIAQTTRVKKTTYSVSFPYDKEDGGVYMFDYNDEILTLKVSGKTITYQKFNTEKPKETLHKVYNTKDIFPKNWVWEGAEHYEDVLYIFYSSYEGKKTKRERLYVLKLNVEDGKFEEGFNKLLITTNHKVSNNMYSPKIGPINGFNGADKFNITSQDNGIIVRYKKIPLKKQNSRNNDIYGYQVFDNKLEKIWENVYTMPYTETQMKIMDYILDDDFNIYILVNKTEDKKRKDDNYNLEVFKYSKDSKEAVISELKIADKFITNIGLFKGYNNNIVCAGYYSDGGRKSGVNGVVYFNIDHSGKIIKQNSFEFPVELLNEYARGKEERKNNRKEKKDEADYLGLKLEKLFFDEDGAITILGEHFHIKTNNTGKHTSYYYHFYDVLATKIDANGNILWTVKVPKRQIGLNRTATLGFKHVFANDSHYIIYLDNIKNKDLPKDETPVKHTGGQGGYLVIAKINDEDGSMKKEYVFNTRKVKNKYGVSDFDQNAMIQINNALFMQFTKGKSDEIMIKVNLD
jgi:hypothetical protein